MPVLVAVGAMHTRSRLLKLLRMLGPWALGIATVPLLGTGFTSVRPCTFSQKTTIAITVSRKTNHLMCFSIKGSNRGRWVASKEIMHVQVEISIAYCIGV